MACSQSKYQHSKEVHGWILIFSLTACTLPVAFFTKVAFVAVGIALLLFAIAVAIVGKPTLYNNK